MTPPRVPDPRALVRARRAIRGLAARGETHHSWCDGVRMQWRRWGQGPDLVLVHGGHGSWMHWLRNIDALAEHFSVWLPDLPGFGESDALPGHPHNPQRQRALIDALATGLTQLPTRDSAVDVVGFSFGGLVAAQLAATRPAAVRRLALLGTAGHGGARRQTAELLNWRATHGAARWQAHATNLHRLMLHDGAQVDATALVAQACSSQATRFRSRALSRDAQLRHILALYTGKLLLVWGEHDVTADPRAIGPTLIAGHANRVLRTVANAGHWVQYEQSEACNALLAGWFAPPIPSPHP